jgi:hypothetical protein
MDSGWRSSSRLKRLSFSKSGPTTLMPTTFCRVSAAVRIGVAVPQACIITHMWTYLVNLHENKQVVAVEIHLVSGANSRRDRPDNLISRQLFVVADRRLDCELLYPSALAHLPASTDGIRSVSPTVVWSKDNDILTFLAICSFP